MFSVNQNGDIFVFGKSMDKSSFDYNLLALYMYINSGHSDARTTKPAMRKECDHMSSRFGLTNKSTWPKSLTFGAKISCHTYHWICGLPFSVVSVVKSTEIISKVIFHYQSRYINFVCPLSWCAGEVNRPFALRCHVTSFLWKRNLYNFAFEKRLVGHILNKVMVIWFFKPAPFS